MTSDPTTEVTQIEAAIFELLCDDDDEMHVDEALATLAMVAAAVCCMCDDRGRVGEAFTAAFRANVDAYVPDAPRLLS